MYVDTAQTQLSLDTYLITITRVKLIMTTTSYQMKISTPALCIKIKIKVGIAMALHSNQDVCVKKNQMGFCLGVVMSAILIFVKLALSSITEPIIQFLKFQEK